MAGSECWITLFLIIYRFHLPLRLFMICINNSYVCTEHKRYLLLCVSHSFCHETVVFPWEMWNNETLSRRIRSFLIIHIYLGIFFFSFSWSILVCVLVRKDRNWIITQRIRRTTKFSSSSSIRSGDCRHLGKKKQGESLMDQFSPQSVTNSPGFHEKKPIFLAFPDLWATNHLWHGSDVSSHLTTEKCILNYNFLSLVIY